MINSQEVNSSSVWFFVFCVLSDISDIYDVLAAYYTAKYRESGNDVGPVLASRPLNGASVPAGKRQPQRAALRFVFLRSQEDRMIPGFTKIVEERIRRAQKKGEFENLEGTGKPLNLADDQAVAEELRLAYKILKNADCLPPEIEVKKEIQQTEALLAGMTDTAEKYHTLKKLNFLIMKLNTLRSTSIKFEESQKYADKLIRKLESSASRVRKK